MIINRLNWISGAKFIAILAVVVVHCNGLMYNSNYIAMSTSFSVTLFVLLSGIGTYVSYRRKPTISMQNTLYKVLPLIKSYVCATIILYFLYKREFILSDIIKHILFFDIEGTFYFVFFFLQLKIISTFLVKWYSYCNTHERKNIWHASSLLMALFLSIFFIKYTYILPLYGGGKYLFGGSYFFVYYLGIILGPISEITPNRKQLLLLFISSSICWFFWSIGIAFYKLPFDIWLRPYLGYGDNPPSINYIVFAILTLFVCYSFFCLISITKNKLTEFIINIAVFLGDNTLEIFLYHFSIMKLVLEFFPQINSNLLLLRFVLFPTMIILPVAVKYMYKFTKYKFLKKCIPKITLT